MKTRAPDRPQEPEPLDAGALLGRVAPEHDEGDNAASVKSVGTMSSAKKPAASFAIDGLIESLRILNRRQRLILVIVVTIVVGVPAWFFRFQPLPTMALGAFINRWTGTIYVVGANGKYVVAEPQKDSDR